ncbi:MAG: serine--tRNA ligase [Puniceicoccales bacterium]|jgi:seryl-tRNA synthetase|nr:serine--tRNA ligase [Puniceicoccales bacterium]
MLDLKYIRECAEEVKAGISRKKFRCDLDVFLAIDRKRREMLAEIEDLRAEQNGANDSVAKMEKGSAEFREKVTEMRLISEQVGKLDLEFKKLEETWKSLYLSIPNVPHHSVPLGKNETENQTIHSWGDLEKISKFAVPHYDIHWFGDYLDFPRGVKVTGSGFPFYIGDMARLVRALISFFLDEARKNGYIEFMPPILVNADSAMATGQLPDKEGQMYHAEVDDYYCIPTAEVPVTNFFRNEIFSEEELPVCRCAYTPCFRREAGSWGKDVRGLNRLHQFDKVELVKWANPNNSFDELEKLKSNAESMLQKLGLAYRVLAICTGDMGFPHSKQYDLEVFAGGQKRWLEVSSCSNFTDFQARRAGIRFKSKESGKLEFVHTLNGSGLAVPRVLAALLENNLQQDGRVKIPEVLRHWINQDTLGKKK